MSDLFNIAWDARSLQVIKDLGYADILLAGAVQAGLAYSGRILVYQAQQLTWQRFQNPSGALAASIHAVRESPYEIEIGSELPYARRREFGFSGMTDSLGRFYADDPGAYYLEDAMNASLEEIEARMASTINAALARLGG